MFTMNAHTIQHQHFNQFELPCDYSDKPFVSLCGNSIVRLRHQVHKGVYRMSVLIEIQGKKMGLNYNKMDINNIGYIHIYTYIEYISIIQVHMCI